MRETNHIRELVLRTQLAVFALSNHVARVTVTLTRGTGLESYWDTHFIVMEINREYLRDPSSSVCPSDSQ